MKLHQPAVFYGVESTPMRRDRLESTGPKAGFMELAEGPEILSYFRVLMGGRLLESRRVRFTPIAECWWRDASAT